MLAQTLRLDFPFLKGCALQLTYCSRVFIFPVWHVSASLSLAFLVHTLFLTRCRVVLLLYTLVHTPKECYEKLVEDRLLLLLLLCRCVCIYGGRREAGGGAACLPRSLSRAMIVMMCAFWPYVATAYGPPRHPHLRYASPNARCYFLGVFCVSFS